MNSRLPDFLQRRHVGGDRGGPASASGGSLELVERVRRSTRSSTALARFMDHGEQVARRALGELPQGMFPLEEEQDNGAVYRVTVEITDDELVVDLRDNPDQDRRAEQHLARRLR